MDETIKIYHCKQENLIGEERSEYLKKIAREQTNIAVNTSAHAFKAKAKLKRFQPVELGPETRTASLAWVLVEKEEKIKELQNKHPWFPIFYNWLTAGVIVLLMLSFVWWGIDIMASSRADAAYEQGVSDILAEQAVKEQQAQEEQEALQNSIETRKARDIEMMSKFIAGIQGFVENKGYTDADLETYAQCPVNRVLNTSYFAGITNLEDALSQADQWVGYSALNQPTIKHRKIAEKVVNRLYDNEPQPCSNSFCWTEFTENGLWLKNNFEPANFNNTWRAG